MSYIVKKKNRVLRIPEEKAEEYAKMGYEVTDENGEVIMNAVVTSVAEAQRAVNKLQKENEELKAKLTEATLYAEDADKKIVDLQKENEELKAAIQAQTTTGSAASVSEDSGKKKITKTSKQSE
ncbi:MAG: hypothetical protein ACLVDG_00480 [Coprococcus sp.]